MLGGRKFGSTSSLDRPTSSSQQQQQQRGSSGASSTNVNIPRGAKAEKRQGCKPPRQLFVGAVDMSALLHAAACVAARREAAEEEKNAAGRDTVRADVDEDGKEEGTQLGKRRHRHHRNHHHMRRRSRITAVEADDEDHVRAAQLAAVAGLIAAAMNDNDESCAQISSDDESGSSCTFTDSSSSMSSSASSSDRDSPQRRLNRKELPARRLRAPCADDRGGSHARDAADAAATAIPAAPAGCNSKSPSRRDDVVSVATSSRRSAATSSKRSARSAKTSRSRQSTASMRRRARLEALLSAMRGAADGGDGSDSENGSSSGGEGDVTLTFCLAVPFSSGARARSGSNNNNNANAESAKASKADNTRGRPAQRPAVNVAAAAAAARKVTVPSLIPHLPRVGAPPLTVVLDLDETLVVARHGPIDVRPGVDHLIQACREVGAEIVVWTAGVPAYIDNILRGIEAALDASNTTPSAGGGRKPHHHGAHAHNNQHHHERRRWYDHVISRNSHWYDENGANVKDIRMLGNRPLERILVVENNPLSVLHQPFNAVLVQDFSGGKTDNDQSLEIVAQIVRDVAERLSCGDSISGAPTGTAEQGSTGNTVGDGGVHGVMASVEGHSEDEWAPYGVPDVLAAHPALQRTLFRLQACECPDGIARDVTCLTLRYQVGENIDERGTVITNVHRAAAQVLPRIYAGASPVDGSVHHNQHHHHGHSHNHGHGRPPHPLSPENVARGPPTGRDAPPGGASWHPQAAAVANRVVSVTRPISRGVTSSSSPSHVRAVQRKTSRRVRR